MVEQIVEAIMTFLQDKVPEELIAFVISLCPVLECRGGMIAARLMEIPFIKAFLICYIGICCQFHLSFFSSERYSSF